jgi:hypothetical protein
MNLADNHCYGECLSLIEELEKKCLVIVLTLEIVKMFFPYSLSICMLIQMVQNKAILIYCNIFVVA